MRLVFQGLHQAFIRRMGVNNGIRQWNTCKFKQISNCMERKNDFLVSQLFQCSRSFCNAKGPAGSEMIKVTFIKGEGERIESVGKVGDTFLDVVVNNDLDIDGFGACEGTLSCSTCHLIFKKEDFNQITDKVTDDELDMLDMAYGLTDTSRLGCQVTLTKKLEDVEVTVPDCVNDARS